MKLGGGGRRKGSGWGGGLCVVKDGWSFQGHGRRSLLLATKQKAEDKGVRVQKWGEARLARLSKMYGRFWVGAIELFKPKLTRAALLSRTQGQCRSEASARKPI